MQATDRARIPHAPCSLHCRLVPACGESGRTFPNDRQRDSQCCRWSPESRRSKQSQKFMLELRPTCENCNTALPPDCLDAMICTFECTFCRGCVEGILNNVCPNCGGGFCPRPIRSKNDWKGGDYLGAYPASRTIKHRPVDKGVHVRFSYWIKQFPPELR